MPSFRPAKPLAEIFEIQNPQEMGVSVFQIARFQKLDGLKPRAGMSASGSPADRNR